MGRADKHQSALTRLREKVEEAANRKPKTPKDFDILSETIFEKTHERLSATTLKRVWGYLLVSSKPRVSTLDILAQFVDYQDWKDFCQQMAAEEQQGTSEQTAHEDSQQPKRYRHRISYAFIASLFVLVFIGSFAYSHMNTTKEQTIIRVGDTFSSPHDYLRLFGINAKDSLWGQVLPKHPQISIWGPQYHHHEWHNEGNKEELMPTITEYWSPEGKASDMIAQRNFDQYKHYTRLNELRITFMKDLVDSNYVYLGVYRLSLQYSDTTKCVWERVARDCDLDHLELLEGLAN